MLHPHTELRHINDLIGYGVFATQPIPAGTITWVLDPLDQVLDFDKKPQLRNYPEALDRYTFVNADGHYILCWDLARFINHSCNSNCLSPGFDFEIAVRDIAVGEELTNDYGSLNLDYAMQCHCGSPQCRKVMKPEDFLEQAPHWDALLRQHFQRIDKVEQPLWNWVTEKQQVEDCLNGRSAMPSITRHRRSSQPRLVTNGTPAHTSI